MGAGASSLPSPPTPPASGRGRRHRSRRQVRVFSKAQNVGDLAEHVARASGLYFSSDSSDALKADVILSGSSQGADADNIFFKYCGKSGGPAGELAKAAKQTKKQTKKKTKNRLLSESGPKIGKLPESGRFCTKIAFAKQLKRASAAIENTAGGERGEGGGETPFSFFPQTWRLPDDEKALLDDLSRGRASTAKKGKRKKKGHSKTYIVKPDDGSQGDGIFMVHSREGLASKMCTPHSNGNTVVQRYVEDTMLLDGRKFDLRIYVLVTRLQPLEVHLCKEGLVRVCTEPYVL